MSAEEPPQQEAANEVEHVNLVEDEEVKYDGKQEDKCDKKEGKKSSPAWEFFDEIKGCPVGFERAKCKFFKVDIGCNSTRNGTSGMMNHLKMVCAKSPLRNNLDKLQKTLQFEKLSKDEKFHNLKVHTFSQERLRKKVALMCIKDNQPFRIVEHEGFRELLNEAEPKFKMPSRWTVARDCLKIYSNELLKLKKILVSERVSFTTDTWTSIQNINYMCLTAHWINKDWKICKRILNFRQIRSHKGDAIGRMLVELFRRWGIDRIFTITLDNASSNDTAISHLKNFLRGPEAILENKFLHMRCCAHILNLVVKDGLKEQNDSIIRIRNAVRYVRSSPARLEKFRKCVKREKIKCDRMVCLDVDTRWNSTYTMLEVAVKYKGAFIRMITEDSASAPFFNVAVLVVLDDNTKKKKKKNVEEAAFSTGGRTIDAYRSSLAPKTAEALICSQDWLRTSGDVIDLRGEPEEYLQFEKLEDAELKTVGNLMEKLDIDD
ncbi:BED-type domain-containing protein [Heracleum sosnowskyi]|uniref:BED-type domain-containing protein n=1 Tax=Heracleum sosnowskyi TaxID=360622 RepID=A0AAD8IG75_9APIA|nr:BED-type domain-containing protein [Heracleum sosnowskyi]